MDKQIDIILGPMKPWMRRLADLDEHVGTSCIPNIYYREAARLAAAPGARTNTRRGRV